MNYLWTTITVENMDESVKFYSDVIGLTLRGRHPAGQGVELAFLGDGETKIELVCRSNTTFNVLRTGITLGFEVNSLEETMENLKEHAVSFNAEILSPAPNARFFFAKDPNGIFIQFVEKSQ